MLALAASAKPVFVMETLSTAQRARIDSVFSAFNSNRWAGGRIDGFTIGAGRVRNIAFEKRGA